MQTPFSRFVYTDFKTGWDCKGTAGSLTSGFPIGGKRPIGTRFYCVKSSVLYLLRPLLPERECCPTEHTVSGDSRTDGFCEPSGLESGEFAMSTIRLFGCRWCVGAKRISMEILVAERHHWGSKTVYHTPSRRSDASFVTFQKRFSLSWEDRFPLYLRFCRLLSWRKSLCWLYPSPQVE